MYDLGRKQVHERWKHCSTERGWIRVIMNVKLLKIKIASTLLIKIMD